MTFRLWAMAKAIVAEKTSWMRQSLLPERGLHLLSLHYAVSHLFSSVFAKQLVLLELSRSRDYPR